MMCQSLSTILGPKQKIEVESEEKIGSKLSVVSNYISSTTECLFFENILTN